MFVATWALPEWVPRPGDRVQIGDGDGPIGLVLRDQPERDRISLAMETATSCSKPGEIISLPVEELRDCWTLL